MPSLKTTTFWLGGPSARMQTKLIDLAHWPARYLSDSDLCDLVLSAGTLSDLVDILTFEHSVRLQHNGRNASVDRTLQEWEWLFDRLDNENT